MENVEREEFCKGTGIAEIFYRGNSVKARVLTGGKVDCEGLQPCISATLCALGLDPQDFSTDINRVHLKPCRLFNFL